jgi:GMP synthase (glutamine-hydrolysing)
MPVLVLRHEPFEHLGHFAEVLDEHHVAYRYHDLGEPIPPEQFSALIIMGGPMSANDDSPGLHDELTLIEKAMGEDHPVLGICLGAQLIAKALGARVYRNPDLEIGWEAVRLTDAGRAEALFDGIASPETFFHWHGETFELPAGAEWLAYSDKCRHQAYRYGRRVYGLQFHPEVTAEMVADWCAQPVNCGDVQTLPAPIDPHLRDQRDSARRILTSWLKLGVAV